ncbi:MAG: hypothetical protein EHM61_08245, partial [Acidobacteria bacterium]
MKTYVRLALLVFFLASGSLVFGQEDYYLPQIADGQGQGLVIKTTFVFFNPSQDSAGIELSLTDDNGDPRQLTIPDLGTDSTFAFSLGPGETRFLQSSAEGPLLVGAARVAASRAVGVSAVFTILNGSGGFLTEAGVGSAVAMQKFVIPVDTTGSFNTGLALMNVAQADSPVTFRLRNESGGAGPETSRTLPASAHQALFVTELFQQLGPFRGTLEVESLRPLAAVVLRQNLATFTSTTLPVIGSNSQQLEFQLPHVANGVYQGGSVRTTFVFFNLSAATAQIDADLTGENGSPFPVSILGGAQNSSTFRVNLAPGASAFLQTNGSGTLASGGARVTSTVPVGVASIFTLYDTTGTFQTEAGVGNSTVLSSFTIPVDTRAAFDTGVALFNPGPIASRVTVRLLDKEGIRIGLQELTLPAAGQQALLVRNAFQGASLQGSLSITATAPLSALTLRLNAAPLSYTTLPRTAQAFAGIVPRPPLLAKKLAGVAVDSPVTLEAILDAGYRLRGAVRGDVGTLVAVSAQAQGGDAFPAVVDSLTRRYSVAVPPGVYSIQVCYRPALSAFQGAPTLIFDHSAAVTVQADSTVDIEIPKTELYQVSGTIGGLGSGTSSALVRFTGTDGKSGGEAFVSQENTFSANLPSGSYVASTVITLFGDYGTNHLAVYDLGTVTISGSNPQLNLALPANFAILLGRVQIGGMALIPNGSFIAVIDTAAPLRGTSTSLPNGWTSSLAVGPLGDYRGQLPRDHGFEVQANVKLADSGYLSFPIPARQVTLSANLQQNFSLSASPTMIAVSGVVRHAEGGVVNNVVVTAFSEKLTGVDQAGASVTGKTNSLGEFTLSVPAGS